MTDPTPNSPPPAHNMADIARMFLDGVRQSPDHASPKRTSPKERIDSQPAPAPFNTPAAVETLPPTEETPIPLPRVILAFTAEADPDPRLIPAAARLAKIHDATIGILSLQQNTLQIQTLGLQPGTPLPPINTSAGLPNVQIARALFTLRHAISHWIIAAPDTDAPEFPRLAAAIADWLLITPIGNDAVVAAYQEFKRALAISTPANDPLAVLLSADHAAAATVHARLRRAAAVFLKKDLTLAAITPASAAPAAKIATFQLAPEDHPAVYAAILDELCGTLTEAETEPATDFDPAEEFTDEILEAPLPLQTTGIEEEDFGGPPTTPDFQPSATQHSIDIDGPLDEATTAAVNAALHADQAALSSSALFDHLTNVLDPEEREALNAALFDSDPTPPAPPAPPSPGIAIPGPTQSPPKPDPTFTLAENQPEGCTLYTTVPTAPPARSTGFTLDQEQLTTPPTPAPTIENRKCGGAKIENQLTLRVHNLLTTPDLSRPAQWQSILRAIPDLSPNAILLDAKPPMPWAAESALTLLPDAGGGSLHLWMLEGKDASWFALKEWATEHRPLLALTHRALLLNTEAPITVHLVLPLKNSPTESPALLRTPSPHLQLYRLHPLQWNTHHGIIVVPLT